MKLWVKLGGSCQWGCNAVWLYTQLPAPSEKDSTTTKLLYQLVIQGLTIAKASGLKTFAMVTTPAASELLKCFSLDCRGALSKMNPSMEGPKNELLVSSCSDVEVGRYHFIQAHTLAPECSKVWVGIVSAHLDTCNFRCIFRDYNFESIGHCMTRKYIDMNPKCKEKE